MAGTIPATIRRLVATRLSTNFREAAEVVTEAARKPGPEEILVENKHVGINATDINVSAGRYFVEPKLPVSLGFDAVGTVVAVGEKVAGIKVGDHVIYMHLGAFSSHTVVPMSARPVVVPESRPEYLALMVNGCTADLGLLQAGKLKPGETVLITAAAGGTGQLAVQLARRLGCRVIGTCRSQRKVAFLRDLECDRVVNLAEEDLADALKEACPGGVDVVFETIGGKVFLAAAQSLAIFGRLVVVGFISGYASESGVPTVDLSRLPVALLSKSASATGFFLPHYASEIPQTLQKLIKEFEGGNLKVIMDNGKDAGKAFTGLEGVPDAVEHLHGGKNIGKVYVTL